MSPNPMKITSTRTNTPPYVHSSKQDIPVRAFSSRSALAGALPFRFLRMLTRLVLLDSTYLAEIGQTLTAHIIRTPYAGNNPPVHRTPILFAIFACFLQQTLYGRTTGLPTSGTLALHLPLIHLFVATCLLSPAIHIFSTDLTSPRPSPLSCNQNP